MTGVDIVIDSDGLRLRGSLALPPASPRGPGRARHGLVLCHGFPAGPRGAATAAQTYPELAARLARDAGWVVLAFNLRGTGDSEGDFSLGGWLSDLRHAIGHLLDAADGAAELRILPGAGHRLRHDPRAIAVLLGWLDRQV